MAFLPAGLQYPPTIQADPGGEGFVDPTGHM